MSSIIIIVFIFTMFVLAVLAFKGGRKVNINLPDGASVKVSQNQDGKLQFVVEYDSYEDRPSDYELQPELMNEAFVFPDDSLNREFWQKFANFNTLPPEEQESMLDRMVKYNIIHEEDRNTFYVPTDVVAAAASPSHPDETPFGPVGGATSQEDDNFDRDFDF